LTKAEYAREYRQARRETARLVISGKREIRREYIKAFSRIAKVIRENRHKPFLEEQIRSAFPKQELYRFLMRFIMEGRRKGVKLETDINKRYILEALEKVPGHGLSAEKISKLFDQIAEKHGQGSEPLLTPPVNPLQAPLLSANSHRHNTIPKRHSGPCRGHYTRFTVMNVKEKTCHGQSTGVPHDFTFRQSYSLSKSVWGAVGDTENKVMDVVWGGISQGRDVRSVATDLMAYLKCGPEIVKGRWGKLEPGTKEYAKRLGSKGVDYRAMRLYRSEIHRNQQEAAVTEGEDNPACTGEYDWILMPGRGVFLCTCPELAAGGPYTKETIPDYPHPNCDCMVEPRLADSDDLIRDLKDYVNGVPSEGANEISLWSQEHGLADDGSGVKPQGKETEIEVSPLTAELTPLSEEEMNELGKGRIRNFKTETLDMDEAIEKAELMLKRLEITNATKDEKEMAKYVLEDLIKGAKIKKELYVNGYFASDKGNIFITDASSSEEITKQVKPIDGFSWGNATEGNKFAKAFSVVNSDSYMPYDPVKNGLEYSIKGTVDESYVIRAISARLDAQNRIKNSIISRNEMPYFLRGESMSKKQFDEMISSGYRDLTGITALTANEKHNYSWLHRLNNGSPEALVRFNYLRDDNLEKKIGMVQVVDLGVGGTEKIPDEVDIGGSRVKIERYKETTLEETDRGEALKIYDVFVRFLD
jgi:hypothetical protein